MKKMICATLVVFLLLCAGGAGVVIKMASELPNLITVADYEPLLVSEVFDRNGKKIGEFHREKRILVRYENVPKVVIQAFVAAEDASFFEHGGLNYLAIVRAMWANIMAGRKVQGASTITQQVARSLLLTKQKTYKRKIKEAILAHRMEENLTKEDILYLYLNQIYLGHGAYGVAAAADIYFRKPISEINLAEAALLAGLPQAPSRYTPVYNPKAAKQRQKYVLNRMEAEDFIDEATKVATKNQLVKVYIRQDYREMAPYYLETIRQLLVSQLGEETVLDKGIKIYTGLDLDKQLAAQKEVRAGLRSLDKRQGYRGAKSNLVDAAKIQEFLLQVRNDRLDDVAPFRMLQPDGAKQIRGPLTPMMGLPAYAKLQQIMPGIVSRIDDKWGLVEVQFAESKGLIDLDRMKWARPPNPEVRFDLEPLKKPSQALKIGDVIDIKIVGEKFSSARIESDIKKLKLKERPADLANFEEFVFLDLEQEPVAQASLLSFDQNSSEIIAMVGGYDFTKSEFNRTIQAARQTGSVFKPLVYLAALDKGYSPATPILDAPLIFEEEDKSAQPNDTGEMVMKKWKPTNHSKRFIGDILFRNALVRSMNVPTVKIIEKIGVDWVADYARRMGVFSPLNMDYTLALGSSGLTLYEVTKVFAEFGRYGQSIHPLLIHRVEDKDGNILLEKTSLDQRFSKELSELNQSFEERRLDFLKFGKDHPDLIIEAQQELNFKNNLNINAAEKMAGKNIAGAEAALAQKDLAKGSIPAQTGVDASNPDQPPSTNRKLRKLARKMIRQPPIFFPDQEQMLRKTTGYVITSLLQAVVSEKGGTGARGRALGRPVAGKTGTTNGYYDAWFVGYTPDIVSGVWVGFDEEKSLGKGEVGGRAALPIWLEFMKVAHQGLPPRPFSPPKGIVFANIDNETGKLASATSKNVVRQAFIEGSEPKIVSGDAPNEDEQNFFREDLTE